MNIIVHNYVFLYLQKWSGSIGKELMDFICISSWRNIEYRLHRNIQSKHHIFHSDQCIAMCSKYIARIIIPVGKKSLWNHGSGKISGLFAWKSSPLNRLKSPSSISSLTTSENLASSHSRTPIGIILPQLIFDITNFLNLELKICWNRNKVAWIIWKGKMYSYCPFWAFLF